MVECKKKFGSTHYAHFPTKDYGGFMDIANCDSVICQGLFEGLREVYVIFHDWRIIVAIPFFVAILFVLVYECAGARERCPKCKKGFLRTESRDHPETEPSGKEHTYRDFYLVCQNNECDYKEKIGESELVA